MSEITKLSRWKLRAEAWERISESKSRSADIIPSDTIMEHNEAGSNLDLHLTDLSKLG